jgi:putative ABC transport system permease protein
MKFTTELKEGARISVDAIRSNLLRSILTTLGIVIGIVTVTLMATALQGLQGAFQDAISFIGTDVLYVSHRAWFIDSEEEWRAAQKRSKITLAQCRALERNLGNVRGVAPAVHYMVDLVRYKDRSSSMVTVIGTNEQFAITSGVTLSLGRFFTKAEAYANHDLCVIGSEVADNLFLNRAPLGEKIRVGEEHLEVIGVMEKRGSALGRMSLDNQIIIPIGKMVTGYQWDPSCSIQVKAADPANIAELREELRGIMRKVRRVPPGHIDDFAINQQEQLLKQFKEVSTVIATTGFFLTGLSLFVGGIGIMNIMFVSVSERTAEIGLRKALGARRRTILLQFLMEAAGICLLGAVVALVCAGGLVQIAKIYLPKVGLSPTVILLALTVALVTGIVSGFLPAWRAARMNPVDALRNE